MKKLIGIVSLLLAVVMLFTGCFYTQDITVDEYGSVSYNVTLKLTEEELTDLLAADESNLDLDISQLPTEDIGGVRHYVINTSSDEFDDLGDSSMLSGVELGEVSDLTPTEFYSSKSYALSLISKYIKDANVNVSITFPYEITLTNGVLSNQNKTVSFDGEALRGSIYAVTSESTAEWATSDNPAEAVDVIINNYINPYDIPEVKAELVSRIRGTLTWEPIKNATEYYIFKTRDAYDFDGTFVGSTADTSFNVSDLKPGTTYYAVVAKNDYFDTEKFFDASFEVMKSEDNSSSKPTISSVTAGKKKATIKIKKYSYADGYIIYQSKTGKTGSFKKVGKTTKTTYTKSLSKGKYYFKVKAYQKTTAKTYYTHASSAKSVTIK